MFSLLRLFFASSKLVKPLAILAGVAACAVLTWAVLNTQYERGREAEGNQANVVAVETEQKIRDAGNVARRTPTVDRMRDGTY